MKSISFICSLAAVCGITLFSSCSETETAPRHFNIIPAPAQSNIGENAFALKNNSVIAYSDE